MTPRSAELLTAGLGRKRATTKQETEEAGRRKPAVLPLCLVGTKEVRRTRQEKSVLAHLGDVLARIAPEATAVVIVRIIFKLISRAIDDEDRWRRLMSLAVPLLALVLTLAVVVVWWLLGDGGLQVILHGIGSASITQPRSGPR